MMFRKSLAVGLVLLMVVSGFAGLIGGTGESNASDAGHLTPVVQAYKSHAPIRINSNADFANQASNEGWKGSGTQTDPYIIDNYDIDGSGNRNCLDIRNTAVHFVVRNCFLHDAGGNSGLYLYNVTGGILDNITASKNYYGIYLYSFSSNTVSNNIVSNNSYGIRLDSSSNNTISNNTASNNYYGCRLTNSRNNTISDSTFSFNHYGLYLSSSSIYNKIFRNDFYNNTYGIYSETDKGFYYLAYNMRRTSFGYLNNDPSQGDYGKPLRRAVAHCIDKEYIVNSLLDGGGIVAHDSVSPTFVEWINNSLPQYSFNLSEANITLDSAGWVDTDGDGWRERPDGAEIGSSPGGGIEILVPPADYDPVRAQAGEMIASNMQKVGINATAVPTDFFEIVNRIYSGDFDMYILGWSIGSDEPTSFLYDFFDSNGTQNYPGYRNASFDALVEDALITNNTTKKHQEVKDCQAAIAYDLPYDVLYFKSPSKNTIFKNNISFNENGTYLLGVEKHIIYQNNIIGNANQSYDSTGLNQWNASYPTGGNYWSDYNGTDNYSGPGQNISGPDGIGDTPYTNILGGSGAQDNYPLMNPTWYPSIEIISPSYGAIFNVSNVTVSWHGSDATSGIDHYEIRIDGSSWTTVGTNTSYTFTGLSDDSHTVDVKVIDKAGNINTTTVSFTIDTTAPTITQHSPTGQNVSVDSTINLTFSEPMNRASVQITVSGLNGTISWNGNTAVFTPAGNLSAGTTYFVNVTGADTAGNPLTRYMWNFSTAEIINPPAESTTGNISGVVVDENGDPVAGATVTVQGTNITAITDSTGHFLLENVSAGPHNLTISREGFNDTVTSVTVTEGETTTMKPVLQPMASQPVKASSLLWWIILVVVAVLIAVGLLMRKKGGKEPLPSVDEETANPEPEDVDMEEPEEITKPAEPEAVSPPPPAPENTQAQKPKFSREQMIANIEKAYREGKMSEEMYRRNMEKFGKL